MSLAYDILYSQKCRSTHHKLAMDALRQLRTPDRQRWEDLFLYYVDWYLEGAKAPDDKFKDFRNHVLHVREKFWGGACKLAYDWYGKTVDMLRRRDWPAAVYSAGVMSHYFTDPFMPFHTGQTESEGNVHRAVEWSICKSYDSLRRLIEARGYPTFEPTNDPDDWLAEMIRRGAIAGNQHYEVCIDHYNLDLGSRNPPAGLDDEMRDRISEQLGLATVGLARVLERAFVDAAATPDSVPVAITLALSTVNTPVQAVKDFVNDRADRIQVAEIYAEFKVTGKVVNTLPADDRAVRKAHAAEVLEVPLFLLDAEKTRPPGQKHGTFEPLQPKTTVAGLPTRRKYDIHGNPLGDDNQPLAVRRYDAPVTAVPASPSRSRLSGEANTVASSAPRTSRPPALVGARSVSVGSTIPAVSTLGYSSTASPPPFGPLESVSDEAESQLPARTVIESVPPTPKPIPPTPRAELNENTDVSSPPIKVSRDPLADRSGRMPAEDSTLQRTGPNRLTSLPTQPEAKAEPEVRSRGATKFYLELDDDLEKAPTIGNKTAQRFANIGVKTVRDFLGMEASALAAKLNQKGMNAQLLREWQDQARLAAAIPNIRGHDAQIMVGCGLRQAHEVAAASVEDLQAFVQEYVTTSEGQRVLRGGQMPDRAEITQWISWAKDARALGV